jgi:CheY-like chemotaxis protein
VKKLMSSKPPMKTRSSMSGLRPGQRQMLLYIEADEDNWRVAKLRLVDRYDVVRASSAEQACELLGRRGREFAAILMDVELGSSELTGIELTALLRGRPTRDGLPEYARLVPRLDIPIILVVAHGAEALDPELALATGMRVIEKPVEYNALNLAIAQAHLERTMSRGRDR